MPGKRTGKGGQGQVLVAPGFGRAVYEGMVRHRRKDGRVWRVEDLAEEAGVQPGAVSAWLKGTIPRGDTLGRLARVLGTTAEALLACDWNEIYLINLPDWMQQAIRRAAIERHAADAVRKKGLQEESNGPGQGGLSGPDRATG